jgi:hypothetical protein
MSEPDTLDLAGAAAEAGVHYDTFRKHWRAWADPRRPEFCAFPPPFRSPPPGRRGTYAWRRSAIAEWKAAREAALCAAPEPRRPGRPALRPDQPTGHKWSMLAHQRAQLARLMETT